MTFIEPHAREYAARAAEGDGAGLESFLTGLTELSLEAGIGIADGPTLYVLEPEDRDYVYATDKDGHLILR